MENQAKPKVSVCIPVYNGEQFLPVCMQSVLSQDFDDFELVVVDNCSTDTTEQVVAGYDDPRIRYIKNESNIGSIGNFNKCINVAQGEYFVLLPHDDMLLPGALSKFSKSLEDEKVGMVYSAVRSIDADGNEIQTKTGLANHDVSDVKQAVEGIVDHFVPIQLAMVRTEILQRLGGFEPKYGLFCDIQMWLKVVFDNWSVAYHDFPLSCHRVHANQGQQAFLKSNLKELSKHWGKELDENFWIENNREILLMKLVDYICEQMQRLELDAGYTKTGLLKIFIRAHLPAILMAAIHGQGFVLRLELKLFVSVSRYFGLPKMLFYYPYVFIAELFKRIKGKLLGGKKVAVA